LGGWVMGISKDSKNKEAAFQYLQWSTGKDMAVEFALEGASIARYSVGQDPQVIEAFPYYPILLEALKSLAIRGNDRSWAEVQRTIGVGLSKVLLGGDPETTLKATAGQVFDQLQKAGYQPEKTGPRP